MTGTRWQDHATNITLCICIYLLFCIQNGIAYKYCRNCTYCCRFEIHTNFFFYKETIDSLLSYSLKYKKASLWRYLANVLVVERRSTLQGISFLRESVNSLEGERNLPRVQMWWLRWGWRKALTRRSWPNEAPRRQAARAAFWECEPFYDWYPLTAGPLPFSQYRSNK